MNQQTVSKRARPNRAFRILCIQYLLVCALAFASDLDDALILEQVGEIPTARLLYAEWLEANRGSQEYPSVLFRLALLSDSARDALDVLDSYSINLPPAQSAVVFARMAALESLIGLPREAARHYEMASKIGGRVGELYLLDSIKLKFVMGEFAELRGTALRLADYAGKVAVRDEATAVAALSLAHMGDYEGALAELSRYSSVSRNIDSPYFWLVQLDIAKSYGYPSKATSALASDFKNSTIEYIARNKVSRWEVPAVLLESAAD